MKRSVSSWVILLPLYICLGISGFILFILVYLYGYAACYEQLYNVFHNKASESYVWPLLATGSILVLGIAWATWRVLWLLIVILFTRLVRYFRRIRGY